MKRNAGAFKLTRRRFAFWVSLGFFQLGETLNASIFDEIAAATIKGSDPDPSRSPDDSTKPEHWTFAENNVYRWFEREHLIDGKWVLTGITTPIDKSTGEPYTGHEGYLDESLVPADVRNGRTKAGGEADELDFDSDEETEEGKPSAHRRDRHGRPPSKWLRSLHADELRIWMKTIEVPETGVEGMTFWEHLTRDHSFDPVKIEGLTIDEQAKLHSAAHYGY